MAEPAAGDSATRNAAPRAPVVAIVDDDPAIRSALSRLARSLGYAPASFAGAEPLLNAADDAGIAVVVTDGFDVHDLIAYCEEHLAHFAVPRYVRVCDALPKTPNGKIDKKVLTMVS